MLGPLPMRIGVLTGGGLRPIRTSADQIVKTIYFGGHPDYRKERFRNRIVRILY